MGRAILGAVCLLQPKEPIKCRETQMHQNHRLLHGRGHGGTCWQLILSDMLDERKPKLIGAIMMTDWRRRLTQGASDLFILSLHSSKGVNKLVWK